MSTQTVSPMALAHREQRKYARHHALIKYPMVAHPYIWGQGTPVEHTVNKYKEYPDYRKEYFKQLKIIRAKRFN